MKSDAAGDKLISENAALKAKVCELEALLKFYEEQFRLAKHRQFGASSEKSIYDQPNLFNEAEATADENVAEPELNEVKRHYRKRRRLVHEQLPDNLPVEVVEHDLEASEQICPVCGGGMHVMGREKRRELVIIPAQAKIVEHVRKVYACRDCEHDECGVPIRKAPMDEPVIKGSFASPEAIAQIMTQKFVMGAPLYRQEQEWQRNGIMLSRQTMSNWLLKATEAWLEPIYEALREIMFTHYDVLYADETTLQVLREPGKTPQSKSYMWLYMTGDYNIRNVKLNRPIILYEYQPDRKAKRPADFLRDFKGYLHTDGYEAYHGLPQVTVAGCWAHARRKFDEAMKTLPAPERENSLSARGKRYCDALFDLERQFAELTPAERLQKRRELSAPLAAEFFVWADSVSGMSQTPLGKAARYALKQRVYLERYLEDGRLEISNNRAERSIKPFVIDRKNFLFANTPRGAKASAIMFSIIETAKANGLNPYAYLTYVFKNAPNWDICNNITRLEMLIPYSVPEFCRAGAVAR